MATMSSHEVSAALQAAVAAAAEIASFGVGEIMPAGSGTSATTPTAPLAAIAPAPAVASHMSSASAAAGIAATASPVEGQEQEQYPARASAAGSVASTVGLTSATTSVAGEDQPEDDQHHNDNASVTSSVDAGGEKHFEESEEDAAKRLARSRERNREHARRTRLRKKAQLEALQGKVRDLETEKRALKQKIEECSIASILINLAEPDEQQQQQDETVSLLDATIKKQAKSDTIDAAKISMLTAGKRKRFASVDSTSEDNRPTQALRLKIDGEVKILGPKAHINWKSGVYSDEHGVQRQLTSEQLEGLRRERNRMHAKMTRDRKKNFIATIERTIEQLERENQKMRDVLDKVGGHEQSSTVAPATAKKSATVVSPLSSPALLYTSSKDEEKKTSPPLKKEAATHAFTTTVATTPKMDVASHAFTTVAPATTPSIPALAAAAVTIQKLKHPHPTEQYSQPKRLKVTHGFSLDG